MSLLKALEDRSNSQCELCGASNKLAVFTPAPATRESLDNSLLACDSCRTQIDDPASTDSNHWRCLNDSMWSEAKAVKIIAWRMLTRLRNEGWPQDLLDMLYLDEETLALAHATGEGEGETQEADPKHLDCNGVELTAGDSVVLIKDLDVKGSSLTAKRGTAVRNIRLDPDNHEFIEGKVDVQQIVILTKFVKKS
jgi:protein PhnA